MTNRTLTVGMLSLSLAAGSASPALADGAASTRNIIFGAAAAAGTLLIINHNKKVHERYAEDARRQAAAESQASNAQAAYAAERRAYDNEVAVNGEYKREVATQHQMIESLRRQVAAAGAAERAHVSAAPALMAPVVGDSARTAAPAEPVRLASTSWGWGQL